MCPPYVSTYSEGELSAHKSCPLFNQLLISNIIVLLLEIFIKYLLYLQVC